MTASDVVVVTRPSQNRKSGDVFSGVVEGVGSEVKSFKAGDRVFGSKAPRTGAHNYTVIINEGRIIAKVP